MELIHIDSSMRELRFIDSFSKFDASISLNGDVEDNSWMISMPVECYSAFPIVTGDYICIENTEWGGLAEKIRHNSANRTVEISGVCWRGMLLRGIIRPNSGQTHLNITASDGNEAIRLLLGNKMSDIFEVSEETCPMEYSYSFRFATLLDGLTNSMNKFGHRINIEFKDGKAIIGAKPIVDYSDKLEFSGDMNGDMVSEVGCLGGCNHILALGSGEMEERQTVELWKLPDGTVTDDPNTSGIPSESKLRSYLYDYSAVESLSELKSYARRKLKEYSRDSYLEFTLDSEQLELNLGDTVGAKDKITGLEQKLRVSGKILTIDSKGINLKHSMETI